MSYSYFLANEADTLAFGARCTTLFVAPATVYLNGDLGAGKTTFVRGLLQGLGHQGAVKSPTYAVVESYTLPEKNIHHFDLYRFATPEEWEDAGLDELFEANAICLIEWAQQGGNYVPDADWILNFERQVDGRQVTLLPIGEQQRQRAEQWQN